MLHLLVLGVSSAVLRAHFCSSQNRIMREYCLPKLRVGAKVVRKKDNLQCLTVPWKS